MGPPLQQHLGQPAVGGEEARGLANGQLEPDLRPVELARLEQGAAERRLGGRHARLLAQDQAAQLLGLVHATGLAQGVRQRDQRHQIGLDLGSDGPLGRRRRG